MAQPRVIVVGGGPAGVRAAEALVEAGLRPTLVDEAAQGGGQIYRRQPPGFLRSPEKLYGSEAGKAVAIHRTIDGLAGTIDHRAGALAWNVSEGAVHLVADGVSTALPYDALIIAAGATDRVFPIPGWTLPGVYTLGAAQIALKAQACAIGRNIAFLGTGPLLYLVASQYAKAGAGVAAVLDTSPFAARLRALMDLAVRPRVLATGLAGIAALRRRGIPVRTGVTPIRIDRGESGVAGVAFRDRGGREIRIACDAVAFGYHLRAETQLADLAGCRFAFDPWLRQWLPEIDAEGRSSVPGVYLAGDGVRLAGADAAEASGALAACAALADLGIAVPPGRVGQLQQRLRTMERFRRGIVRAFPWPARFAAALPDDTIVCRCEAITAGTLRRTARELGAPEMNRAKAFSRVGMGRCQGRYCGLAGAEIVADALAVPVEAVGRLRGQAPVKPLPVAVQAEFMSEEAADVVIVGGGFMGAATAFFLRRRGRSVILLESGLVGQQASGVNFGNVRRQGRYLPQLPLANRAWEIWGRLPELLGEDCEFLRSGHLRVCYSQEQAGELEAYADAARAYGLDLEMISGNRLHDRFPFLGPKVVAGSYSATDGHANPRLSAPAFGRAAARAGATVHENTEVVAIDKTGVDFEVETRERGRFRAPTLLVAAGAWAAPLAARFGEPVPTVVKGPQMSVTEPVPYAIAPAIGVSTKIPDEVIYFRQVKRGNIVIGGPRHGPASAELRRASVLPANTLIQMEQLRGLAPALARLHIIRVWSGVECYLPDSIPIMGPSGKVPGLYYAFAFCGHGFQLGPGVGDVMAELIDTGQTSTPIAPFHIGRFGAAA